MIPLALKALSLARTHWRWIGIGLLMLALTFQTVRYERQKAATARSETAREQQVAEYREAYSKAVAIAYAAKEKREKEYENARTKSAEAYADLSGRYRAAVMQRAARANTSGAERPDMRGDANTAGLSVAAAPSSGFSISTADALKTADLGAYAMGCFTWAKSLQDSRDAP